MSSNRKALLALLGAGLLSLGLAPAASANPHDRSGPAYVKEGLSLRSGPGMGYRIVGQLSRGDDFEIRRCVQNWCLLSKAGPDGWAPVQSLGFGANPFRRSQTPAPAVNQHRHQAPVVVQPQLRPHAPVVVQPQTRPHAPVYAPVPQPAAPKAPAPVYNPYPTYR